MTYTTADARQQLLEVTATAAEHLGGALAQLGTAYELLDETTAERLEDELFQPVKLAYGRLRAARRDFAARHELHVDEIVPGAPAAPAHGVRELLGEAEQVVASADGELAELQDSMLPVEVGDAELRAGLEQVRTLLGTFAPAARELLRTFGR